MRRFDRTFPGRPLNVDGAVLAPVEASWPGSGERVLRLARRASLRATGPKRLDVTAGRAVWSPIQQRDANRRIGNQAAWR